MLQTIFPTLKVADVRPKHVLGFLLCALALMPSALTWAGAHIKSVPVLSSYPVYQTVVLEEPSEQCHIKRTARRHSGQSSSTPAIVGSIIGGALGNAVGSKKTNKRVGAVVGGVLGYSIGRDIGRDLGRQHANRHGTGYTEREVCETFYTQVQEQRLMGYDVSYAFAGQTYKTRMDRDPGPTIRVRVQVQPL
jgi:uncharacterized protein YcfJ